MEASRHGDSVQAARAWCTQGPAGAQGAGGAGEGWAWPGAQARAAGAAGAVGSRLHLVPRRGGPGEHGDGLPGSSRERPPDEVLPGLQALGPLFGNAPRLWGIAHVHCSLVLRPTSQVCGHGHATLIHSRPGPRGQRLALQFPYQ